MPQPGGNRAHDPRGGERFAQKTRHSTLIRLKTLEVGDRDSLSGKLSEEDRGTLALRRMLQDGSTRAVLMSALGILERSWPRDFVS